MAAQQISLHSSRLDAPAVSTLIHYAGVQHDPVLASRRHGAAVRFADLADGGNFIGTGAQLSGQGDLIPDLQGMDLAEMVVHAPIMASQGDGTVPDTRVCEVACSLGQCAAPGALINLHTEANGGDFQSSVGKTTTYLVMGEKAGQSKRTKAEQLGTKVISEAELLDLLGQRG